MPTPRDPGPRPRRTSTTRERRGRCPFCREQGRRSPRIVYRDALFRAEHLRPDDRRTVLGVLRLATVRHVPDLGWMTPREASRLGTVICRLSRALQECTGAAGTYCFGFTEAYRHVHLALTARYPGLPPRYVRLGFERWPAAPHGGPAGVAELCHRLRDALRAPAGPAPRTGPPRRRPERGAGDR